MISKFLLALLVPVALCQFEPNVAGARSVYVHLFEWKWTDIAAECENWLGPKGYGGIQVSPPNEHRVITNPHRPWYERYQPVSYKIVSRSGSEAEFRDMVERCNRAGVRIYVDAIINHMAGGSGTGIGGSQFNAGTQQYPGVPFGNNDFTNRDECPTASGDIDSYGDAQQVRNCRLLGMPDLAVYKEYTIQKIVGYLDHLVDIGVAGFRIDAAKHMWPAHLANLLGRVKNLNEQFFPAGSRPFIYHEVIDLGGEPLSASEYVGSGRVTEFKYGMHLSRVVQKIGGEMMKYLRNFGEGWGMLNGMRAVSFIDNHDNQRGHGGGGNILNFRNARAYKIANAFMLAHPYGFPQVMSSYYWERNVVGNQDRNDWIGPPSNASGNTNSVTFNADDSCSGGWMCEHRWRQISNMVGFRNTAGFGAMVHWWDNYANQIAFGRGQIGSTTAFIVINNDGYPLSANIQTGLPPGVYCDMISGYYRNGACTGKEIVVKADRTASFTISNNDADPFVAIHINAKRL